MLRNLSIRNSRPLSPTRRWTKSVGPGESSRMATAITAMRGLTRNRSRPAATRSKARLAEGMAGDLIARGAGSLVAGLPQPGPHPDPEHVHVHPEAVVAHVIEVEHFLLGGIVSTPPEPGQTGPDALMRPALRRHPGLLHGHRLGSHDAEIAA